MRGTCTIDVVMPVKDGAETVVRAVESVLAQTVEDFRLFVVDDGSTDGTSDVIDDAFSDERMTVVRSEHRGVSAARNLGASLGAATWLAFLDADDEVVPTWLEHLTADPDSGLVRCASIRREAGRPDRVIDPVDGPMLAGAFGVSRTLFETIGGYDERLEYSENTDLHMRLRAQMAGGEVATISTPLMIRHIDGVRRSTKYGNEALRDAAELMLDKHEGALGPGAVASFSAVAGLNSLQLGERRRARRHLRTAVRIKPSRWKYVLRYLQTFVPSVPVRGSRRQGANEDDVTDHPPSSMTSGNEMRVSDN